MSLRIALISMSDYRHLPPGGEVQLLHNFLAQSMPADIELHLLGMSFAADTPAGAWTDLRIGDTTYPFFPLCQVLKSKEKARIPFRIRMVAGIRKYYDKAGLASFDAIYVQAPETIRPLMRYTGRIALHVHTDPDLTLRISRFPIFRLAFFSALYTKRIQKGILRADRILWSADAIRQSFLSTRPALRQAIDSHSCVVHSSYDPALVPGPVEYAFDEQTTYFITVGRLAKGKRVDLLLQAFAAFRKQEDSPRAVLLICGGGEELDNLRACADDLGIRDAVHFAGDVDRPTLASYLQHARCFLFASVTETMSLVVLESLYMGVPVITTDVGDLRLAVRDGETGYVVQTPDKENYLHAIREILSRPAREWEEKCKKAAEEFSPQRMNNAICDELRRMCAGQ